MQPRIGSCFRPYADNRVYNLDIGLDPCLSPWIIGLMISVLCDQNSNGSNSVGFPLHSVSLGMVAQGEKGQIIEVAFTH